MKNISGQSDKRIEDLRTTFVELRKAFLGHAAVITEITVLRILDDMGVISSQFSGMSSQVSDLGT
jgi:hypothetical protein